MRRLNLRWLTGLTVVAIVCAGAVHLVHGYQLTRIAPVFLREARRAQRDSRAADTIRHLRSYLKLLPNDVEGLELYAEQLVQIDRIEPAYLTLEKVVRLDPSRTSTRKRLATLAIQLGRFHDARTNVQELLSEANTDGELWKLKARCQIGQAEYKDAKDTLEAGIAVAPAELELYGLLAALLQGRLKNPEGAVACMDRMVTSNPENHHAYLMRGQWRMQVLDAFSTGGEAKSPSPEDRAHWLQEALSDAKQAERLSPDAVDTLAFVARVALVSGDSAAARASVERGIKLHPTDERFYLMLTEIESSTSNPAAALNALRRGVAAVSRDRDLRWNLANRLIDAGDIAEAATVVEQLRSAGHPAELLGYLESRILIRQGKWLDAIRRLEANRSRLQDWPGMVKQADLLLAFAYRATDAGDQQLTCLRRAVELDPQWVPARLGLAEALLAANSVREASEEYRRVLRFPDVPVTVGIEFAKSLYRVTLRKTGSEQDWSEFDRVLDWIEQRSPDSTQLVILRAEKLVAQGREQAATELIATARSKRADEIDLWIGQIALAQMARDWDSVEQLLQGANDQLGDGATLRIVRARYLVQRYGTEASILLKDLSKPDLAWTEQEKLEFTRTFALFALAIKDYDMAEQLGLEAARMHGGDLSVCLLLFDVALRAKRPELMEQTLQQVRQITGDGPLWHYGQAVRLALLGKIEEDQQSVAKARFHLAKCKVLRPAWPRIPLLAAEIETRLGDMVGVTEQLLEAIRLGDRNPEVLSRTVSLLFAQQRFIEADQVIRRLQERQNLFTSEIIRSASEISLRLNDSTRALDLAEQLVRSSDNVTDKVWLAQVLGTLGRYSEAEKQLRNLIEEDQTAPEPWIALIQVLARAGQRENAERIVVEAEKAIASDKAPLAIAQSYELLGKLDLARERYQLAIDQAPESIAVLRRYVEFQMRTGRSNEVEPMLKSVLQRTAIGNRDRQWATRNLALAITIHGGPQRLNEAQELIDQNLAQGPVLPADERVKALVLARQPSAIKRRQAIAILERMVARETDNSVEDRFLLASLYLSTGDRSKARTELLSVLALRSDDLRFIVAYLQLLLQSGELVEAELWVNRMKALSPDDVILADFQTQLLFAKGSYAEAIAQVKSLVNREQEKAGRPPRQLWAARRLEEFTRKLIEAKNLDEAAKFASEAESYYEQHVMQNPGEALVMAEFYAKIDQIDRALDLLKKRSDKATSERVAAVSVAILKNTKANEQQLGQLQQVLQAINSTSNRTVMLTLVLADLMSWRGEYEEAIKLYHDVLSRDKGNVAALNNLAMLLAMSGRDTKKEALGLVQRAIDGGGPSDVLLDTRGLIHLAMGVPARALVDFEESVKAGESSDRFFHLALAYAEVKQSEAGKRALRHAQELGLSNQALHPLERQLLAKLQVSLER